LRSQNTSESKEGRKGKGTKSREKQDLTSKREGEYKKRFIVGVRVRRKKERKE